MNLYNELIHTPYAQDISRTEFLRAPLGMLFELVRLHMEVIKRETNYASLSTARLASIVVSVANGFAGSKNAKPLPIDDLLPFPLDEKALQKNEALTGVIQVLIKRGKLPIHVIASLNSVISF